MYTWFHRDDAEDPTTNRKYWIYHFSFPECCTATKSKICPAACSTVWLRCNCCECKKSKEKKKTETIKSWKLYYTLLLSRCDFFFFYYYFQAFERQRNIVYTERCFQGFTQRQLVVSIRCTKKKKKPTRRFCLLIFSFSFISLLRPLRQVMKKRRDGYTSAANWIILKRYIRRTTTVRR